MEFLMIVWLPLDVITVHRETHPIALNDNDPNELIINAEGGGTIGLWPIFPVDLSLSKEFQLTPIINVIFVG